MRTHKINTAYSTEHVLKIGAYRIPRIFTGNRNAIRMTKLEFENLPLNDKAKWVWENGIYLETMAHGTFKINLYAVGKDFIEVYLDAATNEVDKIALAEASDVNKYLDKIELPSDGK